MTHMVMHVKFFQQVLSDVLLCLDVRIIAIRRIEQTKGAKEKRNASQRSMK
jgi:hypothetical protein